METKEWFNEVPRTNWPSGIWDSEPDRKQWLDIETGLPCLAVRARGHWCGYVGVDSKHPSYEKEYDDVNVDVHGGLTYSNHCSGRVCHIIKEIAGVSLVENEVWWLGFDCAHLGDTDPDRMSWDKKYNLNLKFKLSDSEYYKPLTYIEQECASLAKQLKELA